MRFSLFEPWRYVVFCLRSFLKHLLVKEKEKMWFDFLWKIGSCRISSPPPLSFLLQFPPLSFPSCKPNKIVFHLNVNKYHLPFRIKYEHVRIFNHQNILQLLLFVTPKVDLQWKFYKTREKLFSVIDFTSVVLIVSLVMKSNFPFQFKWPVMTNSFL